MDKTQAKLLLQACRPNGADSSRPDFAEALALADRDPELKAWWEAQQSFDRKVAAKLGEVPLPAGLRATLLADRKIEPFRPAFRLPIWLAAAAVVTFFLVAGFHPWSSLSAKPLVRTEYEASLIPVLGHDDPALAMLSPDHDKVAAWLKERNSPMGSLPSGMATLPSIGCQTLAVHGHSVSLICFSVAGGLVHLFIIDQRALADPPGSSPEFKQDGDWSMASWSDGAKSYMLATRTGADTLKHLL